MIVGLLILLLAAFPAVQQAAVPADLEIVLASAPRPAGDGSEAEAVQIFASGRVVYSAKETAAGPLAGVEATLPGEAIAAIWQEIARQRFFELDEVYRDPEVSRGDLAVLQVTADGITHGVMTVNIGVDAFDAIAMAINDQLPAERQVFYNALHVDAYQRIPR